MKSPQRSKFIEYTKPNRIWYPTGRCGCGNCRKTGSKYCAFPDHSKAIMLWASRARSSKDE